MQAFAKFKTVFVSLDISARVYIYIYIYHIFPHLSMCVLNFLFRKKNVDDIWRHSPIRLTFN